PGQLSQRDDEIDLIMLERAWVDAIRRRDAAVVSRIMAEDFEGIDPAGNVFTQATYLPDLRTGVFGDQPIVLDEIKARIFGESAVVTSRIKISTHPTLGRLTNVYVRRKGRWQCVASHMGADGEHPQSASTPSEPNMTGTSRIQPNFGSIW